MTAKVWSALVTYEQLKTAEKMTPGLSRMAFWWDPVPTDTSTSWFPCGPRYMSTLRKDNCSWLVKKSSSCRPRHVPGLFLFVHETKRCFQKAELGFEHVACTAFLHEGIWHLKMSCLSKPHQAPGAPKKPGLAPAMGMWSCSQHWQKPRSDKNTAHPIQCWCCKVQACQWTDFDQKKERKKEKSLKGYMLLWFPFRTLLIVCLSLFVSCQVGSGEQLSGRAPRVLCTVQFIFPHLCPP